PVGCQIAVSTFDQFSQSDLEYTFTTTVDVPSGDIGEHLGPQSDRALDGLEEPRYVQSFDYAPSGEYAIINLASDSSYEDRLPDTGIIDMETGEVVDTWETEIGDSFVHAYYLDEDRVVTVDSHRLDVRDSTTGQHQRTVRNSDSLSIDLLEGSDEIVYVTPEHILRWDLETDTKINSFPIPDYADREEHTDHGVSNLRVDAELGLLHFSWGVSPAMSGGG